MRSPEGQDHWVTGVYREIVEPERIVYTDLFSDAAGNVVPASHYGISGDWSLELLVTVTFEEHEGKTKSTLRHAQTFWRARTTDLTEAGWNETFDKLVEDLAKA